MIALGMLNSDGFFVADPRSYGVSDGAGDQVCAGGTQKRLAGW